MNHSDLVSEVLNCALIKKAKVISKPSLVAPIALGQQIGTIQFTIDGKVVDEQKLLAAKEIKVAGIFGRLWDSLMMLFA